MQRLMLLLIPALMIPLMVLALIAKSPVSAETDLQRLLLPAGCPSPCFLGIQPGITAMEEARAILESHPWIVDVKGGDFALYWLWNGDQPALLVNRTLNHSSTYGGVITLSGSGIVQTARVWSRASFGDLYLLLGEPARIGAVGINVGNNVRFTLPYPNYGLVLDVTMFCPVNPSSFWRSESALVWTVQNNILPVVDPLRWDRMRGYFRSYLC